LRTTNSRGAEQALGRRFSEKDGRVTRADVDLVTLAREIGALKPGEVLA